MRTKNKREDNWVSADTGKTTTRLIRRVGTTRAPKRAMDKYKKYFSINYIKQLIFDPNYVAPACYLLLIAELVLNYLIVENVRYTEIDWKAYMQEVEGFLNGTLDYKELRGDTGPCVYPAGFLYVYSLFYYITDHGSNIKLAQYIFIGIYVLQSWLTYSIAMKTCKLPAYALVLSFITSYRIHSIYVLRLFNDPIAVLLFWAALNAFVSARWKLGSIFFSLAVSIKMNILLYAPCLLLAYISNLTWQSVLVNLTICGGIQLLLGLPFLLTYPVSYIKASFDLGRVFEYKWTVNYRFLPEEIFVDRSLHLGLLALHLILLGVFAPLIWKYFKAYRTLRQTICDMREEHNSEKTQKAKAKAKKQLADKKVAEEPLTKEQQEFLAAFEKQIKTGNKQPQNETSNKANEAKIKQRKNKKSSNQPIQQGAAQQAKEKEDTYQINFSKISQLFVLPFFVTNLIGIACARSLHYQFYSWYFHSLLYLAFSTPYSKPMSFLMLAILETCWNIYPSTDWSSCALHVVHVVLLCGVYKTMKQ